MGASPSTPPRRFPIELALSLSFLPGLVMAAFAMWAAWDHNSQGEIQNDVSGVDWGYWFFIGGSWFAAVSAIPVLVVVALWTRSRRALLSQSGHVLKKSTSSTGP